MAKSEFLQIRLTPEDRTRILRLAEADHLDASTWARRTLLKAVDAWEQANGIVAAQSNGLKGGTDV